MKFNLFIPTKVIFGKQCVLMNSSEFKLYGKKAVIVTGKNSGKKSGALDDVINALEKEQIKYCVFDRIVNNPSLENVWEGKQFAVLNQADFIIAIGGGSPIDGAKAIAVLCTNDIEPIDLLKNSFSNKPLPIIAIPTTAGTGSEVTPYAVLTINQLQTKKSFATPECFPKISFIDPKYTYSLSDKITIDTAFDAFSHLIESYLSKKNTEQSALFAIEGIKAFSKCKTAIEKCDFNESIKEQLMYASYMGGLAITHTGTTLVHAMGYSLTYFKNLSHGHANTLLMGEYLRINYKCQKERIDYILEIMNANTIDELEEYMLSNIAGTITLTEEEITKFAALAFTQGSVNNMLIDVNVKNIEDIYRRVFKEV